VTVAPALHRALIYDDPDRFAREVGAFLRDGLRAGDRVLAAVAPEKLAWVREDLGAAADAVDVMEPTALYDRHGPMLGTVLGYVARHGEPGRGRVRVVAEQPLAPDGGRRARLPARREAAANVGYSRYAASVLCPYDAARLPDEVLEDARHTHPELDENGHAGRDPRFMDPRAFVRERVRVHPAQPGAARCRLAAPEDVAVARALARAHADSAGLRSAHADDLAVAVSEVATNALVHGSGPEDMHVFVDEGTLVCRIRDGGPGRPARRLPAAGDEPRGRAGLVDGPPVLRHPRGRGHAGGHGGLAPHAAPGVTGA